MSPGTCSVIDCGRKNYARGLCEAHYRRKQRSADVNVDTPIGELLGRALRPDESVHHRDGNRLNNDPENLELWWRWQPSDQRVDDRVESAFATLLRYAPHLLRAGLRRRRFACRGQLALDLQAIDLKLELGG